MRRVFIVCNCKFPRGGAISNYIQYLMLAIKACGFETKLISDPNPEYIDKTTGHISYNQFEIDLVHVSHNRIVRHFQYHDGFSRERMTALKRNKISKEDVVIVLGQKKIFYEKILSYRKKIGFKIIGGILEMFERENFLGSDSAYKEYNYVVESLFPQFDVVMPISTYIEDYYKKKSVPTVCLPIMADSKEFKVKQKTFDKARFILPANGKMKDSLESMLNAFASLSEDELTRTELHLCGVNELTVKKILTEERYENLKNSLIIHNWMKYEELIELYQQMNFLVLARDTSQMTLANFPSKVPETMAFGIVPIVSEVGDYTKYYLKDGVDSIFIHGCSTEVCRNAVQQALKLSESEYIRLSINAINCVKTRFDYRVWTETIREMLLNV